MCTDQCIPCILHYEMRISEKRFKVIIYDLYRTHNCTGPTDWKKINYKITTLMNTEIWGSRHTKAQCKMPVGNDEVVVDVSVSHIRARKFIMNIQIFIENMFGENTERGKEIIECIKMYGKCMEILRSKEDFSNEEILEYQLTAEKFSR